MGVATADADAGLCGGRQSGWTRQPETSEGFLATGRKARRSLKAGLR